MGEGGENNTDWYAGAFRLFDELGISWNFWTWKKLDTTNSPASVPLPSGWETITAYAEGGPRPAPARARETLAEFLENIRLGRCGYHVDVVNAVLRRPPLRIPAIFYSFAGRGNGFGLAGGGAATGNAVGDAHTGGVPVAPVTGFRTGDGTRFGYVSRRPPGGLLGGLPT